MTVPNILRRYPTMILATFSIFIRSSLHIFLGGMEAFNARLRQLEDLETSLYLDRTSHCPTPDTEDGDLKSKRHTENESYPGSLRRRDKEEDLCEVPRGTRIWRWTDNFLGTALATKVTELCVFG